MQFYLLGRDGKKIMWGGRRDGHRQPREFDADNVAEELKYGRRHRSPAGRPVARAINNLFIYIIIKSLTTHTL